MKRKNIAAARSAGVSSAKSKVRKGTVKQVLRYVGKYPFSLSVGNICNKAFRFA